MILGVSGAIAWIAYSGLVRFPRGAVVESQMEQVFRAIRPPADAVRVRYLNQHKGGVALVQGNYASSWQFEELRDYYDRILQTSGWRFVGVGPAVEGGRELGLRQAEWTREANTATLYYTGDERAAYGCDYSFSLSWGLK